MTDPSELKPNSHRAAAQNDPQRPKVEKAIKGEVIQRKPGLGKKLSAAFTGDDASSVGQYVLMDVVLPQFKSLIADVVTQSIERFLFGEVRRAGSRSQTNYGSSYNRPSTGGGSSYSRQSPTREISSRGRATHDFNEIILRDRGEAEDVLSRMGDQLDDYKLVTVADLYDLVGITSSFTDNKWGWKTLAGCRVQRLRDGYLLDLTRPEPID